MSGVERPSARERLVDQIRHAADAEAFSPATVTRIADYIEVEFVVVPREDLPEVEGRGGDRMITAPCRRRDGKTDRACAYLTDDPSDLRGYAAAVLALAEWLDAHPPVDPAVEAIRSAIQGVRLTGDADVDARTLAAAGLRVDTGTGGHAPDAPRWMTGDNESGGHVG